MILATLWAIVAMLAAAASLVVLVISTTRAGALRSIVRDIDADAQRPGIRDGDLAARLAGHPAPRAVTVSAGSRHGTALAIAAAAGLVLTFGAVVTGSGFTALLATASLGVSAYVGARLGNARQLRADRLRIRLRRWQISADIPMDAVRGFGLAPGPDGRVWISLWCDASAVAGLPEPLRESAAVEARMCWLRLDPIEAVSTTQLLRLWQFFADRWLVGDVDGRVRAERADPARLFGAEERFTFDDDGTYRHDGAPVAHVVQRRRSRPQLLRAKMMRAVDKLPHVFEVRDGTLRTRWVISKPDATWKTAFYVTDRGGQRVGTLRAVSVASRNFDLCDIDNRVLATLRPGYPRTTVVDTGGRTIAVWDVRSGELFSDAEPSLRPLCLLSPIVARFAGTAGPVSPGGETVALTASPHVPGVDDATAAVTRPPTAAGAEDATAEVEAAGPRAESTADPDATRPLAIPLTDGHGSSADVARPSESATQTSTEGDGWPIWGERAATDDTAVPSAATMRPGGAADAADSTEIESEPTGPESMADPGMAEPQTVPSAAGVSVDDTAGPHDATVRLGAAAETDGPADADVPQPVQPIDGRTPSADKTVADADVTQPQPVQPTDADAPRPQPVQPSGGEADSAAGPVPDPMSPLWPEPPRR